MEKKTESKLNPETEFLFKKIAGLEVRIQHLEARLGTESDKKEDKSKPEAIPSGI